ncbi:MAG: hypothetical protein N4A44_03085 [Alphaproteobacteria bacterium]|jgi:hypothetical protein|nr:hypothetical protein [Alphaproteobacteria bacterium]
MKSLNVRATKVLLSLLAITIMACVNTPASAANISTEQQIENSFYSRPKKKRNNSKRKKHKIKKVKRKNSRVSPRKKSNKTGKVKHKPCRSSKHRNYDMFGKK